MLADKVLITLRSEGWSAARIARAYKLNEWMVYKRMKELDLFRVQLDKSGHNLSKGTAGPDGKRGRYAHLR